MKKQIFSILILLSALANTPAQAITLSDVSTAIAKYPALAASGTALGLASTLWYLHSLNIAYAELCAGKEVELDLYDESIDINYEKDVSTKAALSKVLGNTLGFMASLGIYCKSAFSLKENFFNQKMTMDINQCSLNTALKGGVYASAGVALLSLTQIIYNGYKALKSEEDRESYKARVKQCLKVLAGSTAATTMCLLIDKALQG